MELELRDRSVDKSVIYDLGDWDRPIGDLLESMSHASLNRYLHHRVRSHCPGVDFLNFDVLTHEVAWTALPSTLSLGPGSSKRSSSDQRLDCKDYTSLRSYQTAFLVIVELHEVASDADSGPSNETHQLSVSNAQKHRYLAL